MPDLKHAMLEQKSANRKQALTLPGCRHQLLCYHQVDVQVVQKKIERIDDDSIRTELLDGLLTAPVVNKAT